MANHGGSLHGMRKHGTGWSMARIRQWGSSTQSPGRHADGPRIRVVDVDGARDHGWGGLAGSGNGLQRA